jgi:MFS family permease
MFRKSNRPPMTVQEQDALALRRRGMTLTLLTITYFFSYMDRQILSILLEPIKADLDVTDTQLGLLTGLAFAIFYAVLGIPVARLADRYNRVNIVAISLALWSIMTGLCGLAQNFVQLLLARIGVGVGEAGSSPPSHSMIADLYPPEKRSGAMGIYSLGVVFGAGFGTLIGGLLAAAYGWRLAIIAVAVPGVILAVIVKMFVVEPRRGLSEPNRVEPNTAAGETHAEKTTILGGFKALWQNPAARHLVMAVTVTSLIGYAITAWSPSFFMRSYGLGLREIALIIALLATVAGGTSGVVGGRLADLVGRRHGPKSQAWLVAGLKLAAFPFAIAVYLTTDVVWALGFYAVAILLQNSYIGPTFALIQGQAPLRMRALWAAITLLVINLIGLGAGPTAIGMLSDYYRPMAGDHSLRYALLTMCAVTPWAIFHYWRAGVHLSRQKAAA